MTSTATLTFDQATIDAACAALTHDGSVYQLEDGRELRLSIGYDEGTRINDFDIWGRSEQYSHRYLYGESHTPRPDDMDGSARKIEVAQGAWMWWQPADEYKSEKRWIAQWADHGGTPPMPYEQAFREHIQEATDLLMWGFSVVGVCLYESVSDSRGHAHMVEVASDYMGGCVLDVLHPEYLVDALSQILPNLS